AAEVLVDDWFRDTRPVGDLLHRRRLVAASCEDLPADVNQLGASSGGGEAGPPLGRGGGLRPGGAAHRRRKVIDRVLRRKVRDRNIPERKFDRAEITRLPSVAPGSRVAKQEDS